MTILSVDDSVTIRRIIKKNITAMGHDLLEAGDGAEALATLANATAHIDLVILDWNMPGITGLEVLKHIKADPKLKDTVVMMLTSEADQNYVMEALRAGAKNYLTKPFDGKMLALKIQESLDLASRSTAETTE
jgi:two-component system, chemotaxis family, chemotaxis protein CheY